MSSTTRPPTASPYSSQADDQARRRPRSSCRYRVFLRHFHSGAATRFAVGDAERADSDRGDDIFDNVTTYEWDDDGAAAGARFTWIGADDGAANQGAATMAKYLTSNHG